jgi:hypothetical protein
MGCLKTPKHGAHLLFDLSFNLGPRQLLSTHRTATMDARHLYRDRHSMNIQKVVWRLRAGSPMVRRVALLLQK